MATPMAVPYGVLVLPALALLDRWVSLALGLSLLAVPAAACLWAYA